MTWAIFSRFFFGFIAGSVKRILCSDGSAIFKRSKVYFQRWPMSSQFRTIPFSIGYAIWSIERAAAASSPTMMSFKRVVFPAKSLDSSERRIGRPTTAGKMASGKLVPENPHLTYYVAKWVAWLVYRTWNIHQCHCHTQQLLSCSPCLSRPSVRLQMFQRPNVQKKRVEFKSRRVNLNFPSNSDYILSNIIVTFYKDLKCLPDRILM